MKQWLFIAWLASVGAVAAWFCFAVAGKLEVIVNYLNLN